jgi:EKC/KEOPS complex subunit CGI121/TPRKB
MELEVKLKMAKSYYCEFLLFNDVSNSSEIRQACVAGNFRTDAGAVAILKSSLILDIFQLKSAVMKAVVAASGGRMKTRSLDTEIVFNVAFSKSITDSLKQVNSLIYLLSECND